MDRTLPGLPRIAEAKRPPVLRRASRLPTGPKLYRLNTAPAQLDLFLVPPRDFVTATTSAPEWAAYNALAHIFQDPQNPRKPPYFGGADWNYQEAVLGTYTRQLGSAVLDFVVFRPYERIGIRIVTSRFHEAAGAKQQGYDALQVVTLGRQFRVVDVYESDLISDPTGQAAIIAMKRAIGLLASTDRIRAGTSQARA
jgi:hypothetical protein